VSKTPFIDFFLLQVFEQIPTKILPHYHWYNVPVSPNPKDPMFALRFIKDICTPDDFVVMKLDIDNTPVEEGIINALLADPVAISLIDELFWEHHVNVEEMWGSWGTQKENHTIADSYRLFTKLRQLGIRAHSWV
jgi:hypothetical protein